MTTTVMNEYNNKCNGWLINVAYRYRVSMINTEFNCDHLSIAMVEFI